MAERQKQVGRMDPESFGDGEGKLKSGKEASSDDEEANEDLSLKIVEKHMLMRAARFALTDDEDDDVFDGNKNDSVVDPSSSLESKAVVSGPSGSNNDAIVGDVKSHKKRNREKKKIEKSQLGYQSVVVAKEEQKVETIENGEEPVKAEEIAQVLGSNPVEVSEVSDNAVLRKLLRGPRYFDPPDSNWQTCYNCGEEGHMAVNCSSALKRKKPCFVCGCLDHGARQCSKAQSCFTCKKNGHRAKDCPEKHKSGSQNAKICLKCGDSGHDMFSCRNGYSLDDFKEIQCYTCKSFGHLCCVDVGDPGLREVSCFKCGQLGHTGLACKRLRGETNTDTASPSLCYNCGETGHFARECMSSAKVQKRNFEESTPTLRRHRENKDHSGFKSAPNDLGKAHKRKKPQYDEKLATTPRKYKQRGDWITDDPGELATTPRKSKQRGGWSTDDPGDFSYEKGKRKQHWRSPATPSGKGHHQVSGLTSSDGRVSSSQSSSKWNNYNHNNYHHRFPASRFDNFSSGVNVGRALGNDPHFFSWAQAWHGPGPQSDGPCQARPVYVPGPGLGFPGMTQNRHGPY